jgi:hypothetical protein
LASSQEPSLPKFDRGSIADHTLRAIAKRFYEKVVKVKADVAAILKFFLPTMTTRDAAPVVPIGGMRKGGFSGAL